ncbi:FAD-dependent oxidoreductase [Vallitalea pronyensis]|uniref:FAD-dependent oxidoreductase n=1 Tax=Vallitalea pronyensis TaxID=1348613 RepID=A0A8J8SGE6_9FIRM|nr:FAD-dependent oxidoreductase [Vallitalea pronyensis]QUI22690.1 FAD-dependent oxidoreductase [Vallitalea pronyensis]
MQTTDLVVIGGGPAGMAAAIEAYKNGIDDIIVIERDKELGGILQQCIHNGFGLHIFGEELTGPEYADRFAKEMVGLGLQFKLETMVLSISEDKVITAVNSGEGLITIQAKAIVFAMGCRERTRGALNIPGYRPAGIYTAGAAQRFVNMEGYLPGKEVVILGSGDIGLIMARRMTLEGAKVKMVCELLPYSGGLTRNIVQCLDDYDIPLKLSHTVVDIHGKERLEGITIAQVDENRKPIKETYEYVACDTLLLSVGLIPENELSHDLGVRMDSITSGPIVTESMETSVDGVFACGNVVHVHDLVDFVTQESRLAGRCAARYIKGERHISDQDVIKTVPGEGVRYIVPHVIHKDLVQDENKLYFRVTDVVKKAKVVVTSGDDEIYSKKRPKVAPGEMESIPLTEKLMAQIKSGKDLVIRIES